MICVTDSSREIPARVLLSYNGKAFLLHAVSVKRSFVCLLSHRTPDLGYDWKTNTGRVFNYFCFGAACSEVEIDCLTGDHQVGKLLSRRVENATSH